MKLSIYNILDEINIEGRRSNPLAKPDTNEYDYVIPDVTIKHRNSKSIGQGLYIYDFYEADTFLIYDSNKFSKGYNGEKRNFVAAAIEYYEMPKEPRLNFRHCVVEAIGVDKNYRGRNLGTILYLAVLDKTGILLSSDELSPDSLHMWKNVLGKYATVLVSYRDEDEDGEEYEYWQYLNKVPKNISKNNIINFALIKDKNIVRKIVGN